MPEYGAACSGARTLLAAGQCPVPGCGRRVIEVFASTLGFPLVIVEYDDEPAESLQQRRQAEGERVPANRAIWCRLLTEPSDLVPETFACPPTVEARCSRHARLGTAVVDLDDLRRATVDGHRRARGGRSAARFPLRLVDTPATGDAHRPPRRGPTPHRLTAEQLEAECQALARERDAGDARDGDAQRLS